MDLARHCPTKWSRLIAFPATNGRGVSFRWLKCQTTLLPNREENVGVLSRMLSSYTKLVQLFRLSTLSSLVKSLLLKYLYHPRLIYFYLNVCNCFPAVTNDILDAAESCQLATLK